MNKAHITYKDTLVIEVTASLEQWSNTMVLTLPNQWLQIITLNDYGFTLLLLSA